jgi:dTDP-4-dehydrorhamnose reductase
MREIGSTAESAVRVLILGAGGQVGRAMVTRLGGEGGYEVTALSRGELDLTDESALRGVVDGRGLDAVVNAAAYTAVDKAESEAALAHAVNARAPAVLAGACADTGALFVHYSTDYVFDGENDHPWTEDDPVAPLNVYGRTKLEGEQGARALAPDHAVILRTSWVYAPEGRNFLNTMLRLAGERDELRVVDDQHGAPTSARAIAEATFALLERRRTGRWEAADAGVYHASCAGETTWCGFARRILQLAGVGGVRVTGIATAEFPTPARRPRYSVLDCSRLRECFGVRMPHWETALATCIRERGDALGG